MKLIDQYEAAFTTIERPFAYVNLDFLDQNIRFIQQQLNGKRLRIATKSIRSIDMMYYLQGQFQSLTGWMTFSARETLFLLENGFDSLLCGYPVWEEEAVEAIILFVKEGKEIIWMVDSYEGWSWLDRMGQKHQVCLSICLDINVSTPLPFIYFGTKRSPISKEQELVTLCEAGKSFKFTRVVGLMGYEAQIAGVGDRPLETWKRWVVSIFKRISKNSVTSWRRRAVEIIESYFGPLMFVNGGGSGSINWTSTQKEVTEMTIGSAFYAPTLFDQFPELILKPAVGFALRVTRKPEPTIVVCHGGGYVASGALSKDKFPQSHLPAGVTFLTNEGPGEVQTPLQLHENQLDIGDTVYFRHAKAGELCERFETLYGCRGTNIVQTFKTYRGEGKCFL